MVISPNKILLEKLDQYFENELLKIIKSSPTCQNCKKSFPPSQLKVFQERFNPMGNAKEILNQLTRRQKERAVIQKGKTFEINFKDIFIERMVNQFNNAPRQIYCRSCYHVILNQFEKQLLEDPSTSDRELRDIMRNIISYGSKEDIIAICELLSHNISNRMRKIERHVRRIWANFEGFAKKMYSHPLCKPYVDTWMKDWLPYLESEDFYRSQIGQSVAHGIYSIDNKELSKSLFAILFSSHVNTFKFFRITGETNTNHQIFPFLLHQISEFPEQTELIHEILGALLSSGNLSSIELILTAFYDFPYETQKYILDEIFLLEYKKNFLTILEQIESIFQGKDSNSEVSASADISESNESPKTSKILINEYYFNKKEEYEHSLNITIEEEIAHQEILKQQSIRISTLHGHWKKKHGPSPFQMSMIAPQLIEEKYNSVIRTHIEKYKEEFVTFFKKHEKPIIAFDNEEWHNRVFCIMGVSIYHDLSFKVKLICVEDIYPINRSHRDLMEEMSQWLKSFASSSVISHGTNKAEEQIIKDGGHFQINTQDILHEAKYFNTKYAHALKGEGLKHFEDLIQFARLGCPMLKHDMTGDTFFDLAEVSLDGLLSKSELPKCEICSMEQDVLLYCLEDAFSSLLIYLFFSNREQKLCKDLGYDLLK